MRKHNLHALFYNVFRSFLSFLLGTALLISFLTGCSGSTSGEINSGAPTAAGMQISPVTKTLSLGGTLDFQATGGSEPYTFDVYYGNGTVSGAGATGTYQAPIAEGTAVVRVQDANGNAGYATVEITDAPVIQPSLKTLAITNRFPFGALSGKAPYVFSVVSGDGSINASTGEFTAGVTAGTVVVRVTDADNRSAEANVTVNGALSFTVKNAYVEKDTTYTLAASGGVAPYTFLIASGAGTVDSTTGVFTASSNVGVTAVHVVDALGNFDLATLNTTTALSISPSNALIAKNGNLSFSALGGVPPYSYSIQTGGAGAIGSMTGQYVAPNFTNSDTVRVTDSLGHTSDASVSVTNSLSFSAATVVLAIGNTFDVSTIVSGGIAPLTYSVASSQGSFSGSTYTAPNTPGVYTITVYDSQSPSPNSVTATVLVNSALSLLPGTATLAGSTEKSFSAAGGVPPYTYSVQSGGGSITTAGVYTAPAASGSVTLLVTDARGNTATSTVTVQDPLLIIPTSKTLSSNESFTFTASGGSTPYAFSLVSGSGAINSSSGLYTAGNSAGVSTVRVVDAAGNQKDATVTILNPLSISPPTISLIKSGSITFTASGGAGPYVFSVASGNGSINATTGVFSASATAGTTTVRVTDSLGSLKDATVTVYDGLTISPFTKNLAVNQTFTFTASGGVTPYTYSLFSGVGSVTSGGAYSAPTSGSAVVRVTDAEGNTSDATVSVSSALAINPTSKTLGVNNSFTFSASGGVPPYAYSVVSGSGTITSAGDYKAPATSTSAVIRVTDSDNSTAEATVTVNAALTLSPVTATVAAGGTQSYIAAGGVSPYAYTVVSGGGSFSTNTYTAPSIASGASVSILVTDSLGNTATASININPITVTITTPNSSSIITSTNAASFPVSGTCSESGRPVALSATDGTHAPVTSTPTCSAGTWSDNLNLSSLNDTSITITANHSNVNNVAATPATVTLTKDGSNPTITITSPAAASSVGNSIVVSGSCTKSGLVNLSTASGTVTAVTSCVSNAYSATLDASSAVDGALVITANHTDSSGNAATPATVNVTKDSVAPVITAFSVTNSSPTNTTTYSLTFTATGSPTQYCILENSTTVASCSWQNVALPGSFTVSSTNNAKVLSAWVKDAAGNLSSRSDANSVTLNTAVPSTPSLLTLITPATSPNTVTTPTIQVGGVSVGETVSLYTDSACLIGNLKGSEAVGMGTSVDITSSALTDNTYTFYAKTVNAAGTASSCSTASVGYVLDTAAPTVPTLSINGGANYATSTTATLTLSATGASHMYITNTAGCGSGGTYEAYATSKSWTLATANATNTVYVKYKDQAGNETACVDDSIIHDGTGPDAPTGLSLGSVPANSTTTPTLTWTAAADNIGGSGVASYQVQVYLASDNTIVNAWTSSTSASAITGGAGMLSDNLQYYMKVRAVDNAGNLGSAAQSANWTAITDPCAGTPAIGTTCSDGTIYAGVFDGGTYRVTPGGCAYEPGGTTTSYSTTDFTPTCSGTDAMTKTWSNSPWYDIPGVETFSTVTRKSSSSYRGDVNTAAIVAITAAGEGGYHAAGRYCDKLSYGGYTDWYLPSKSELAYLYCKSKTSGSATYPQEDPNCATYGYGTGVNVLPGFNTSGASYYASTENQDAAAWIQRFSDGLQDYQAWKYSPDLIRCVRRY